MNINLQDDNPLLSESLEIKNEELLKYNSIFNQVWNKSFDGMRLVDKEGIVIFVNDALCGMLEKERDEMIGKHYTICYAAENQGEMLKKQQQRFSSHTIEPHLERLITLWNGKKVWFELSNSFISDGNDGQLLLSIFRNITPRKKTEEKLQDSIASKDKFFSIIAHDLKSPFQGLIGFSNILLNDFESLTKDEIKDFITHISKSANNLLILLQNLLEWSRLQTGKMDYNPVKVDLNIEVETAINILKGNAFKKGIRLNNQISEGTLLKADRNMLDCICQNLLTNAIKFTREGGEVKISALESGDFYQINVADTGVGIRECDMKKLFKIDVSHTTKGTANESGTGLGLLLLKDMVEMHNGKIWVESEFGKGSTFIFTLPKHRETTQPGGSH
jgi:PAS domain S-box-containing protein